MLHCNLKNKIRRWYLKFECLVGKFDHLKQICPTDIKRVVFVCRGNVCRSPYAEVFAKALGVSAVSCGVDVRVSAPVEDMALKAAYLRGYDLSYHRSMSIYDLQVSNSDCLVAMDLSHLPAICHVAMGAECQVTLLPLWGDVKSVEVPDPYGKELASFHSCFEQIEKACENLHKYLSGGLS